VERSAEAFPQAGMILRERITVRAEPSQDARAIDVLRQFRSDNRPTIVFATGSESNSSGSTWYRIHVPGPTNAREGWVDAETVELDAMGTRIVIDVSERRLTLYDRDRLRFQTDVAVGRPGTETPTGEFYVRAGFRAAEPWLGAYAFETSAFANLSEWPGGGIIGIHGTNEPELLGTAVSHGCIRVSNAAARTLERLVPLGTAISIVD
jgi:lipoprotein-anchoring transpeptidase ErfK/SrfK